MKKSIRRWKFTQLNHHIHKLSKTTNNLLELQKKNKKINRNIKTYKNNFKTNKKCI